jgi:hypothetical protein
MMLQEVEELNVIRVIKCEYHVILLLLCLLGVDLNSDLAQSDGLADQDGGGQLLALPHGSGGSGVSHHRA